MHRSKTAFALAVLLAFGSLARAQDKDPLDLTPDKFRELFEDGFKNKKQEIDAKRAIPDFPYTLEPKDIDYTYDAVKKEVVKLEWRYRAAKPGDPVALKAKMGNVISVVLGQGKNFTDADVKKLQAAVKPVPFGNTPPKIEAQTFTLTVARGQTGSLPFAVSDVETPADKLQVTFSADADVEPWLSLTGTGAERALKVVVPVSAVGPVRTAIRLTVTDEDKGTASITVTLRLSIVDQSPLPPEPARMAPGTYFPPVVFAYAGPGAQVPQITIWGPPYSPPGFGTSGGTQSWSGALRAGTGHASAQEGRVTPWQELVLGQTEQDWATLYDAGYRKYWAGQYAQAREYCAAAAELKNDPRAWYFLALSHDALGERASAAKAANYAAALALIHPQTAAETTDALRAVQGALRDRLFQLQADTTTGGRHLALRTPRPELPARPDGAGTARAGR